MIVPPGNGVAHHVGRTPRGQNSGSLCHGEKKELAPSAL